LKRCVQQAYSVREYQVSGPGWIATAKYDIVATLSPGTAQDHVWPALQALLAERLKLSIRREKKVLPIYALTVGKNGPTLRAAGEGGSQAGASSHREHSSGALRLDHVSMAQFSETLSRDVDRPVLDTTGIAGTFDFDLEYAKNGDPAGPSIFTALQQQLGLRLERRKEPVEVLIVEGAVRIPTGLPLSGSLRLEHQGLIASQ